MNAHEKTNPVRAERRRSHHPPRPALTLPSASSLPATPMRPPASTLATAFALAAVVLLVAIIAVTFCPLCNSAIVFDRRLDGEVLDFGTTGRLRLSDLVMYDRQTETWWQQLTGTDLIGEHAGRELVRLPAAIVSWHDFRAAFPHATVLSRETGHSRPYGSNPYTGYDSSTQPFLLQSTPDPRLPAMERVLHVAAGRNRAHLSLRRVPGRAGDQRRVGGRARGGDEPERDSVGSRQDSYRGLAPDPSAAAYSRQLEGRMLEFELRDGRIADAATGSVWNLFGEAVEGPLAGSPPRSVLARRALRVRLARVPPRRGRVRRFLALLAIRPSEALGRSRRCRKSRARHHPARGPGRTRNSPRRRLLTCRRRPHVGRTELLSGVQGNAMSTCAIAQM